LLARQTDLPGSYVNHAEMILGSAVALAQSDFSKRWHFQYSTVTAVRKTL
jgi:hypothetical protein